MSNTLEMKSLTVGDKNFEIVDALARQNINILVEFKNTIIDTIYPIGCIYMSVSPENPSEKFGGTWVAWGSGRVPVGVNSEETAFETVEKTGGNKELQEHTHNFKPEGTISSVTATGVANNAQSKITINPTEITGTVNPAVINMESSGAHSHTVYAKFNKDGGIGGVRPSYIQDGSYDQKSSAIYINSSGAHTHTINAHSHTFTGATHNHTVIDNGHTHTVSLQHMHTFTGKEGTSYASGTGDSGNLQPYITCYMWKRTA